MNYFLAKTDHQLGTCIRMLRDEGINDILLRHGMNSRNRIEFYVYVNVSDERFEKLNARYQTLIS